MDLASLFSRHVERLQAETGKALAATGFDSLVLGSGTPFTYFADDEDAPFRSNPHFAHWCPLGGPHHLLHLVPGKRPRLVRYAPADYWYEQGGLTEAFWLDAFDLEPAGSLDGAWRALGHPPRAAYVGDETDRATAAGLAANPAPLVARLDWVRSYKDDYEVRCLEEATALGARGHQAARDAFAGGASELEVHQAFVRAVGATESELPYVTIVAFDEKAATLHYQRKRTRRGGHVLLLDAGAACRGYACDITRTTPAAGGDARFAALVGRMDELERQLASSAGPGRAYLDVHVEAHRGVARILCGLGLLRVGPEQAFDQGLTHPFLPHGVGHLLGIQVHDVAGRQADPSGTPAPPPPQYPFLRNTRTIEPGQVFTIEPGLYFIPMLLDPLRSGAQAAAFDWAAIDALLPYGGVRVEDNVLVTASGPRNLTRERLPD
ncbi:MAG TPA: Xaa-Pro dipeptidase [Vicinamibacteria bacterium]|nr:Xaa-Pro dipeptidase [Vicinamibacteria bacterium]